MIMNVIMVGGKTGTGKGTASYSLYESFRKMQGVGAACVSLSSYIRNILANDFYYNEAVVSDNDARIFMAESYRLGTKIYPYHMMRRVWERDVLPFWYECKFNKLDRCVIIVESFRELNNYEFLDKILDKKLPQEFSLTTLRVNRDDSLVSGFNERDKFLKEHISETDLDDFEFDFEIYNNQSCLYLDEKLKDVRNYVLGLCI